MKIQTTLELRKQLSVQFFELSKAGLLLDYRLNGCEHTIDLNPLQTCSLLKMSGLINNYQNHRLNGLEVSYEAEYNTSDNDGCHVQACRQISSTFQQFVVDTTFSQYDALSCAIHFERNRQEKEAVKNIYKSHKAAV